MIGMNEFLRAKVKVYRPELAKFDCMATSGNYSSIEEGD